MKSAQEATNWHQLVKDVFREQKFLTFLGVTRHLHTMGVDPYGESMLTYTHPNLILAWALNNDLAAMLGAMIEEKELFVWGTHPSRYWGEGLKDAISIATSTQPETPSWLPVVLAISPWPFSDCKSQAPAEMCEE